MLYDDRPKVSPGVKFKDAELLGMPTIVTVGRGLAEGVIEVRDRATGEREEVPVAEAARRACWPPSGADRAAGGAAGPRLAQWRVEHGGGGPLTVAVRVHGSAPA